MNECATPGGLDPPERKFWSYRELAPELIHLPDKPAGVSSEKLDPLQRAHLTIALKEAEQRPLMCDQFPVWENRITHWAIHVLNCAQPEEALLILKEHIRATPRSRRSWFDTISSLV